jgi:hypothetical protein
MSAILTFAERNDLVAYLRHPLHDRIGRKFWEYSDSALVAEMETVDARTGDLVKLLVE